MGAGASANALPLIMNMNERMEIFKSHLSQKTGNINTDVIKNISSLIETIGKHYTVDTYAKKVFLKNENDLFLTNFLAAYFTYEQMSKNTTEIVYDINGWSDDINNNRESLIKKLNTIVDYRYDSFFATLLKNNKNGMLELPSNINIISWNYDFQFELAYMNYMKTPSLGEAQKILNVFPLPNNHQIVNDRSKIVKLNGSAGFYRNSDEPNSTYEAVFDYKKLLFSEENAKVIYNILSESRSFYENNIKFSWINDNQTMKARDMARDILSDTDILVVVGYSFPYFNRDIDRYIFSFLTTRIAGNIFLQTHSDSFESTKNRMIAIHQQLYHTKPFTELDQFLIPGKYS